MLALKLKEALALAKKEDWKLEILPTRPPIIIKASQSLIPDDCLTAAEIGWRVVRFLRLGPRRGVLIVVLSREKGKEGGKRWPIASQKNV